TASDRRGPALCFLQLPPRQSRPAVFRSILFFLRLSIAWVAALCLAAVLWSSLPLVGWMEWPVALACVVVAAVVVPGAISHIRRVRLIAGRVDGETLGNRHKRQIEIPLEA